MAISLVVKKFSSNIFKCVNTLHWRSASDHLYTHTHTRLTLVSKGVIYRLHYYKVMNFENRINIIFTPKNIPLYFRVI